MSEEKKAFWSSLPGVLSGIAAIIGAVATLYLAVRKDDSPSMPTRDSGGVAAHVQPASPAEFAPSFVDPPKGGEAPRQLPESQMVNVSNTPSSGSTEPRQMVSAAPSISEQLLGIWYTEQQGPTDVGSILVRGTTEYFRNGTASTVMEVTVTERLPTGGEVAIVYDAIATSEWQLHNRELVEKQVDLKSQPRNVLINGIAIPLAQMDPGDLTEIPRLEDMLPNGTSSSSQIVDIQASHIRVGTKDQNGNIKMIDATRWDRHFSPQR